VQVDARGNVVPQLYSKLQASQELRKMLNIGRNGLSEAPAAWRRSVGFTSGLRAASAASA